MFDTLTIMVTWRSSSRGCLSICERFQRPEGYEPKDMTFGGYGFDGVEKKHTTK